MPYFLSVQYETTSPESTKVILDALNVIKQHQIDSGYKGCITFLFTRPNSKDEPTKIEFTELYYNETAFFEHAKATHLQEQYAKTFSPEFRKSQKTLALGFEGQQYLRTYLSKTLQPEYPTYEGYMINEDADFENKSKTPVMMKIYLKPKNGVKLEELKKEVGEAFKKYKDEERSISLLIYEREGEVHVYQTATETTGLLNQLVNTNHSFLEKVETSCFHLYGDYQKDEELKKKINSMNFSNVNFGEMEVGYVLHPNASFDTINFTEYTVSLGPKVRKHPGFEKEYLGQVKYWMKKNNVTIDQKDKYNKTMLYYACDSNYKSVVEYLLDKGAAIECKDYEPMCAACFNYNMDIINMLLEKGASVNVKDYEENTPLHLVLRIAKDEQKLIDLIDIFSKKNLDLSAKDHDGDTYLHLSTRYGLLWATTKLIQLGGNLEIRNNWGNTVFLNCCENHWGWNMHCFRLIQQKGANIKATNEEGNTALHIAARHNLVPIVKFLARKIPINSVNTHGNTPLMEACLNNRNVSVIQYLISYLPDLNIQNNANLTALELALQNYNLDISYVLLSRLKRKDVLESMSKILPSFTDVEKEMAQKKIDLDKIEKDLVRK
eukprot:gene3523-6170_t